MWDEHFFSIYKPSLTSLELDNDVIMPNGHYSLIVLMSLLTPLSLLFSDFLHDGR